MPVGIKRHGGKWRVIEKDTEWLAVTENFKPLDGGGHRSLLSAVFQAMKINLGGRRRGG